MRIRNSSIGGRPAAALLVAATLIAGMQSAVGAPLDFGLLALPGFTFDRDDSRRVLPGICTTYDDSTNKFSVASIPIAFFPLSGGSQAVGMPTSLSINVLIDETGSAGSDPIPEPDFQLTGDISGVTTVLLPAEILEFGFADRPGGNGFSVPL